MSIVFLKKIQIFLSRLSDRPQSVRRAFARAVLTAFMRAVEVYWEPAGYVRPSNDCPVMICSERESMAGCIRGYMAETDSLKGTRETEVIRSASTVTSTLMFWLPSTMEEE